MSTAARVLLVSLLLVMSAAPSASAADGWSLVPSGGSRPSFYAEGVPGTVLQDTVSLVNPTGRAVTVRLSGSGVPVTFAADRVRVPARTRADVPFTVSARDDRGGEIIARDQDGRRAAVPVRLRVGGSTLSALTSPADLEEFLSGQPDLGPKQWPRHVRLVDSLPRTATNKVLHRELTAAGITDVTWTREERGTRYS